MAKTAKKRCAKVSMSIVKMLRPGPRYSDLEFKLNEIIGKNE